VDALEHLEVVAEMKRRLEAFALKIAENRVVLQGVVEWAALCEVVVAHERRCPTCSSVGPMGSC